MTGKLRSIFLAVTCALYLACPLVSNAAPLTMLHTNGMQIVDQSGTQIVLRGINLGGWLVEEPWMCPFVTDPPAGSAFDKNVDHYTIWQTAKDRFGDAGVERIRTAYRNNWVNESDFAKIHADGMNCVRVPFLASLFDEPGGMLWLDNAVKWAQENDLYVILDMHGVPGSQSDQDHTGRAGTPHFFTDAGNVDSCVQLWAMIAKHFRDNPTVAGYDLINEPTASPTSDTLYVVFDRLYNAVRSVDPGHIIIIEDGYTGAQWMPFPIPSGWSNVVYSTHYYDFGAKSRDDQVSTFTGYLNGVQKEMTRRNIPWYVGEFGFEPNGDASVISGALSQMQQDGVASTQWSYKTIWDGNGHQDLWGLYSNTASVSKLNFFTDSEDALVAKCAQFRTEKLTANQPAIDAFIKAGSN